LQIDAAGERESRLKLVLTGALGHIGSGFIQGIRPGDYEEVVLIDDLSTQRYASLFNLPAGVPFRFYEEDVLVADLRRRFEGAHCVIHLAAVTNPTASFSDPGEVERVNFRGTERVAQACLETGARLIVPSTTSVYSAASGVLGEDCDDSFLRPQTPYALSKLRAEQMLAALASQGLRSTSLRFGTIYGRSPGMRFHTAVNRFTWQAAMGLPLTVWRTALRQRRPYLDLSDAVRALRFVQANDIFDGSPYNVVTENASVEDVLSILRKIVPGLSVAETDSPAMNDFSYDVSRDRFEGLSFCFSGGLEAGIRDTFEWLQGAGAGLLRGRG
jgi:UDP-glucose 4-epimerase